MFGYNNLRSLQRSGLQIHT